jgi:hypothetical protein
LASAIAVLAAVSAGGAFAALFFLFNPTTARPGDRVAVRTPGTPANFSVERRGVKPFQRPIRLYLISNAVAADVSSPRDARLRSIGSIVLDKRGHGMLRFTVPELSPDDYAVAGVCLQCARYSAGRTFFVLHVDEQNVVARWRPLMLLRVDAR